MSINSELRELILLRILGVLLVVVGFTLLARTVRSGTSGTDAQLAARSMVDHRCKHVNVDIHAIAHPLPAPRPSLHVVR